MRCWNAVNTLNAMNTVNTSGAAHNAPDNMRTSGGVARVSDEERRTTVRHVKAAVWMRYRRAQQHAGEGVLRPF